MENNYQYKKENITGKNNLINPNRKNERSGINNRNRGYLNIFKNREQLTSLNNQENKKKDSKRKSSKPSDKKVRSQSEPNMNPRNKNENISLEKKIDNGFIEIKNVMNTNFILMNTNIKLMNTKIDKKFNETNQLLVQTNEILSGIHNEMKSQNKSENNKINEKVNNKPNIPSKIDIDMKTNFPNDNFFINPNANIKNTFLNNNNSINNNKYTFPNNKSSTIEKLNYANNPKDNTAHISLKDIEGYNRHYKRRNEPTDSQHINNKYIRNINNIPNYITNKNTRGPMDTYRITSKFQNININEPSNFYNYSCPSGNLSNIENKAIKFISNSNKSSEEEIKNLIAKNNNSSKKSNEKNNDYFPSFSYNNTNSKDNNFNDNYSMDSNQNVNNYYINKKKNK